MGSKGASPQVTTTNQTYTANPLTQGAAGQAIAGAENAAAQPFQMPVAPVAGFNPTQQQAFQQYGQLQNSWQPAFNQGEVYTAQSAAPITAADVNNVYNPMAANVTAQLQNIFGEQNVQNQGNLTAKAGGVGADRIAVGMGDLANQQGLAAGQTYANLYQQALQTAMQEKQLQAGAGTQFQAFGTGTLGNNLQATGAINQAGNQQQAQTQAELNAPYQNTLARIAYQFQTPQYLAGITGGLAPALGGTTNGQQNVTPSYPSALSQILGIGTAGAGIYGALNGGFSPQQIGNIGNMPADQISNAQANAYGQAMGFADGGAADDQPPPFPGTSVPKMGGAEPIPYISMPMGMGHSGPLTGGINTAPPQQSTSGSSNSIGSEVSQAIGIAAKIAPFLALKEGGTVPHYDDGGGTSFPYGDVPDLSTLFPPGESFKDRWSGTPFPTTRTPVQSVPLEYNPHPIPAGTTPIPTPYPGPDKLGSHPDAIRLDTGKKPDDEEEPVSSAPAGPMSIANAPASAVMQSMMPRANQPYPQATQRDWGQNMATSPWMALIKAGAAIASTPGPLGVSLAHGISAGAGSLDSQRKELRSEEELNEKAQKLYQDAQVHLDKYNRMTPYEQADVAIRNKELDQSGKVSTTGLKELDIQRAQAPLEKSIDPAYTTMPPDEKRALAIHALRTGSYIGAEKEFKNPKTGETIIGVWDGQKWGPKQ
jgi:hypothetical protein